MDEDILLNYYNQTRRPWEGPQIDPELVAAASRMQQAQQPVQQPVQQPSTVVFSSQNQPGAVQDVKAVMFPETAHELAKKDRDAKRAQANILKNQELVKLAGQKKETYDAYDNYYKSMIDADFPEMKSFITDNPQVYKLGNDISSQVVKRNEFLSKLSSYVAQANQEQSQLPNESFDSWLERIVPQLNSELKLYNTALVGSPDALSNEERSILGRQLPTEYFDIKKLKQIGAARFKTKLDNFKFQIAELHDILLNEVNDGFNTLAVQSSPAYATKQLGTSQFYPLMPNPTGKRRIVERITDNAPPEVISGAMTMAQAVFNKQAQVDAEKQKQSSGKSASMQADIDAAYKAISEGRNADAVRKMFFQEHGVMLPDRKN